MIFRALAGGSFHLLLLQYLECEDIMSTNNMQTGLLSLPRELRDQIYELALIEDQPISIYNAHEYYDHKCNHLRRLGPPLLYTCHQIRAEASTVYFIESSFVSVYDEDTGPSIEKRAPARKNLVRWIQALGEERRALLKDVGLRAWQDYDDNMGGDSVYRDKSSVSSIPVLLVDLEDFEELLASIGCPMKDDIIRIYYTSGGTELMYTKSELLALLHEEQVPQYRFFRSRWRKDVVKKNEPIASILLEHRWRTYASLRGCKSLSLHSRIPETN